VKLNEYLKLLVGLTIWSPARSVNLVTLQVGESEKVKDLGKFAIHIQCPFRFCHKGNIVSGCYDLHHPRSEFTGSFNWKTPHSTLYDEKVKALFSSIDASVISDVHFKIVCENGLTLEVFPCDSGDSEEWRIIEFGVSHLVYCANDLSISDDADD
jgi:hypothetical protein